VPLPLSWLPPRAGGRCGRYFAPAAAWPSPHPALPGPPRDQRSPARLAPSAPRPFLCRAPATLTRTSRDLRRLTHASPTTSPRVHHDPRRSPPRQARSPAVGDSSRRKPTRATRPTPFPEPSHPHPSPHPERPDPAHPALRQLSARPSPSACGRLSTPSCRRWQQRIAAAAAAGFAGAAADPRWNRSMWEGAAAKASPIPPHRGRRPSSRRVGASLLSDTAPSIDGAAGEKWCLPEAASLRKDSMQTTCTRRRQPRRQPLLRSPTLQHPISQRATKAARVAATAAQRWRRWRSRQGRGGSGEGNPESLAGSGAIWVAAAAA